MRRLAQAASVLSFPPTLAHELTHWAVARTQTDDAQVAVEVFGGRAIATWPPIENPFVRAFAFLSPTVFGLMLTTLWLTTDTTLSGWRLILAAGLVIYTMPSRADIAGAFGRQEVQQNQ